MTALFWPAIALMTAAAVMAVLWPLGRARPQTVAGAADLAVYRDQLTELERDRARGVLPDAEAEAARLEVSRRLLAAGEREADSPAPGGQTRRRAAALLALAGIPLAALILYGIAGTPGLPDAPLQARIQAAPETQDVAILVQRIETHLASSPNDARGWEVLAPVYLRLGRAQDAVAARAQILRLLGPSAAREADLGEAMVAAADGAVRNDAREAFERAVALDASNAKARFFLALAAEQDGRRAEALEAWRALAAEAPADETAAAWQLAAARRAQRLQSETAQ